MWRVESSVYGVDGGEGGWCGGVLAVVEVGWDVEGGLEGLLVTM